MVRVPLEEVPAMSEKVAGNLQFGQHAARPAAADRTFMQPNATTAAIKPRHILFAGLPLSSWAFAIRVWLAAMLALYASFWLQIETPYSAATTVAVLALPTRGQGMAKSGFRLLATTIGVTAAIAIIGAFAQTDVLLLAAFAIWIGLCIYQSGMLDGNRAYAAVLCSITVSLIGIEHIDTPQQVFDSGVARGSAIAVGVVATALVNDLFAAPDYYPILSARLAALHRQVTDCIDGVTHGAAISSAVAANLLRDIAILRPEIASLSTESSGGQSRTIAARAAMVDLVTELFLARALATLSIGLTPALRRQVAPVLDAGTLGAPAFDQMTACRAWLQSRQQQKDADIRDSLDALQSGRRISRAWSAPLYRSRRIAAENGVGAAIHFVLVALFFAMTGWPATDLCLTLFVVIIAFSHLAPDARSAVTLAMLSTPIACVVAGILKFILLDGVSEFQLLALGFSPVIIGLALMMAMPHPAASLLGRLILIFTFAIVAPANPQSYDPSVFLITCLFVCLSTVLAYITQILLPPLSKQRRLRLLLEEARRDVRSLDVRSHPPRTPEESAFHDAARIGRIMMVIDASPSVPRSLDRMMRSFDRIGSLRLCAAELCKLNTGQLADAADNARSSLAERNGWAMVAAAGRLREAAVRCSENADSACAALVLAGITFIQAQYAANSANGGAR
jgi:uncharacterized membrane protein YccC